MEQLRNKETEYRPPALDKYMVKYRVAFCVPEEFIGIRVCVGAEDWIVNNCEEDEQRCNKKVLLRDLHYFQFVSLPFLRNHQHDIESVERDINALRDI